jgi:hypothetical protein
LMHYVAFPLMWRRARKANVIKLKTRRSAT